MIEVKNLRKTFPHKDTQNKKTEKVAVENLSLTIGTGEIFGLLGPNGAGKTTTIRMLTMLSRPLPGRFSTTANIETLQMTPVKSSR